MLVYHADQTHSQWCSPPFFRHPASDRDGAPGSGSHQAPRDQDCEPNGFRPVHGQPDLRASGKPPQGPGDLVDHVPHPEAREQLWGRGSLVNHAGRDKPGQGLEVVWGRPDDHDTRPISHWYTSTGSVNVRWFSPRNLMTMVPPFHEKVRSWILSAADTGFPLES